MVGSPIIRYCFRYASMGSGPWWADPTSGTVSDMTVWAQDHGGLNKNQVYIKRGGGGGGETLGNPPPLK